MWLVLFGDFLYEGKLLRWLCDMITWKNYVLFFVGVINLLLLIVLSIPIVPKLCHIVKSAFHEKRRIT
jgi:hypothetical protein